LGGHIALKGKIMASEGSTYQEAGGCGEWEPADQASNPSFTAIHDFQPPTPARLRVEGTCDMPDPGYELRLVKAVPQGFNPAILLLNLEQRRLPGQFPAVITPFAVRYEEKTDARFTHVTILPLGHNVEVQDVH
jgi:hypothetical protein